MLKSSLAQLIFKFRLWQLKVSAGQLEVGAQFRCGKGCTISKKNKVKIADNFLWGTTVTWAQTQP